MREITQVTNVRRFKHATNRSNIRWIPATDTLHATDNIIRCNFCVRKGRFERRHAGRIPATQYVQIFDNKTTKRILHVSNLANIPVGNITQILRCRITRYKCALQILKTLRLPIRKRAKVFWSIIRPKGIAQIFNFLDIPVSNTAKVFKSIRGTREDTFHRSNIRSINIQSIFLILVITHVIEIGECIVHLLDIRSIPIAKSFKCVHAKVRTIEHIGHVLYVRSIPFIHAINKLHNIILIVLRIALIVIDATTISKHALNIFVQVNLVSVRTVEGHVVVGVIVVRTI